MAELLAAESSGPIASGSVPNSEGTGTADASPTKTRIRRHKEQGNGTKKIGNNQYKDRPARDDPHVAEILKGYHRKGLTDSGLISKMLLEEHGITLCEGSVYRRRKIFGLHASRVATKELNEALKQELILEQLRKDGTGKIGARTVKLRIFQERGIHLTRDYICEQLRHLDPAHDGRGNKHVKAKRRAKMLEMQLQQQQSGSQESVAGEDAITQRNSIQLPQIRDDEQTQNQVPLVQIPLDLPSNHQQLQPRVPAGHEASHARLSAGQPTANPSDPSLYSADSSRRYNPSESQEDDSSFDNYPQFEQDMDVDVDTSYAQPPASSSTSARTNNADSTSAPQSTSTVRQAAATSTSKIAALKMIQETTPRIQELTRLLKSLHADSGPIERSDNANESLTQEEVDLVLKGMEAAALLERQLARMCSQNKPN